MEKSQSIKFGGWHRLWFVLCVLYLIIVIAFTVVVFPKDVSDSKPYKVRELMSQDQAEHIKGAWSYDPYKPDIKENERLIELPHNHYIKIKLPPTDLLASQKMEDNLDEKTKTAKIKMPSGNVIRILVPESSTAKQVENTLKLIENHVVFLEHEFSDPDIYNVTAFSIAEDQLEEIGLEEKRKLALMKARVRKKLTEGKYMKEVGQAYIDAMQPALNQQRIDIVRNAFFAWVVPVALLYIFGWSVGWIYRGFKSQK